MHESDKFAIITRKLCFSYEFGVRKNPILNCVDISVPQGIIYGLLGPSGCGKTSLLKAIIGLIKPDAGFISVFGHKPGSDESGVPGVGIGYMPQDIALHDYLKVNEVFKYFGKVYLKSDDFIKDKKHYFLKLLDLKDEDKKISELSGGQKRRVSLAAAVFTEPRLLILDEPTVGVDPLLSNTIWHFLKRIVEEKHITIIVTTHYIEEMKSAQKVAFMRNGEILKEETPKNALQEYHRNSLEEVFYFLSYDQKRRKSSMITKSEVRRMSHAVAVRESVALIDEPLRVKQNWFSINATIISILIWKNIIQSYRDFTALIVFFLPVFITFLSSSCIGKQPTDVQLGWVVDDDYGSFAFSVSKLTPDFDFEAAGDTPYLPDILREQLDEDTFRIFNYSTLQEAISDAKKFKITGVLYLPANFSYSFYARDIYLHDNTDWTANATIESGSVHLWLDMGNKLLSSLIRREVEKSVTKLREIAYESIGINKNVSLLPVQKGDNIYGNLENYSQISNFYTVGLFMSIIFGVSLVSASIHFQVGYSGECFSRSFSAGIRPHQIIIATTVVVFLQMAISATFTLFFIVYHLYVDCKGSLILAIINVSLMALSGVSSGIFLAQFLPNTFFCHVFGTGYVIALLLVSGVVWPIEGMPYFMRIIAESSPLGTPASAMRRIMNYEHMDFVTYILPGFTYSIVFTAVNSFQSWLLLIRKR